MTSLPAGTARRASLLLLALLAATGLGACSGSAGDAAAPGPTTSTAAPTPDPTAPAPSPTGTTVRVVSSVTDATVSPAPRRVAVPLGATVELVVTSDVTDEVHVHGYDIVGYLPAGVATTTTVVADQPGLFEVETHDSALVLLQLQVQ